MPYIPYTDEKTGEPPVADAFVSLHENSVKLFASQLNKKIMRLIDGNWAQFAD